MTQQVDGPHLKTASGREKLYVCGACQKLRGFALSDLSEGLAPRY